MGPQTEQPWQQPLHDAPVKDVTTWPPFDTTLSYGLLSKEARCRSPFNVPLDEAARFRTQSLQCKRDALCVPYSSGLEPGSRSGSQRFASDNIHRGMRLDTVPTKPSVHARAASCLLFNATRHKGSLLPHETTVTESRQLAASILTHRVIQGSQLPPPAFSTMRLGSQLPPEAALR